MESSKNKIINENSKIKSKKNTQQEKNIKIEKAKKDNKKNIQKKKDDKTKIKDRIKKVNETNKIESKEITQLNNTIEKNNEIEKSKINKKIKQDRSKDILIFLLSIMTIILLSSIIYIIKVFNNKMIDLNKSIDELQYNITKETTKYKNSVEKLYLQYKENQGTHPKVLYFDNGLFGYNFWMAYTPYPKANDMYENPNILVSNDGITWMEPEGFTNPLEDIPENYKRAIIYNSDTHLLYNEDTKQLECWWRYVNDEEGYVIIYRKVTNDGINWSEKEEIIKNIRKKQDYLSPAIIYENGTYKVWSVDLKFRINYMQSNDLKKWSNPVSIKLNYNDRDIRNWHLDVIKDNRKYIMIISSFIKNSPRTRMNLYYSISPTETNFREAKLLLTPTTTSNNWDSKGLYRSSIVKVKDKYYLYYSGIAANEERAIGLIKTNSLEELAIIK